MKYLNQNHSDTINSPGMKSRFLSVLILITALTGCQDYRWIDHDFRTAEQQAAEKNRDLFIFNKYWISPESNRMQGEVLTDPQVVSLFKDTINLVILWNLSPEGDQFMGKYGITSAPAFVIARPDGTFKTRTGFIPKEQFIEFVKNAKSPPGATQQKNAKPKKQ